MKVNQFPDRIIEVKRKVIYILEGQLMRIQLTDYKKTYCVGAPLTEVQMQI
jgi:hypothetical protein